MANINTLPVITWRWVQANDGQVKLPYVGNKDFKAYESQEFLGKEFEAHFENIQYGLSDEVLEVNEKHANWRNDIQVEAGQFAEEKYEIKLSEDQVDFVDKHRIHLKEGAKARLIFDIKSEADLDFFRNSLIKIKLEKFSHLTLVLVQNLSDEATNLASIVASVDEGAKVELIQVDLGSKQTFFNYVVDLLEKDATSLIHAAYFVDGEREHDINYKINHIGELTNSDMQINGALKDTARKRFSGTLNFLTGSHGSVGNEEEFVTLIDEDVRSIAVPLLLAREHDIMGNHAASAGRIDEDIIIYLMSRGLSLDEAKRLAVEAKMTPTLDLIPDEKIKEEVKLFIHEGII